MRRCVLLALLFLAACQCNDRRQERTEEIMVQMLPGAQPVPEELAQKLREAFLVRGKEYEPRTRHLAADGGPRYVNRLILEPSPYLQQHAHNPVDWYPWGDEAFEAARRLDRPVFLSIGYSTCHWCHVMEEESFEDEEVARYINENYIAIKVDREERPDVDSLYMSAVRAMGLGGGWPLNVWLTADRRPFFGGTYFPPDAQARMGQNGFKTVLSKLREVYDQDRQRLLENADKVVGAIESMARPKVGSKDVPDALVLHTAWSTYSAAFDDVNGGLRAGPRGNKFPSSLPIRYLLRYHRRTGETRALDMATLTLDKMAAGGMYDQAGGGFHRYSTDPRWLVPHFEKMLYDNALLTLAYLEAFQASGEHRHAAVARDILRYVARDMRAPEGGFYSATDADSLTPDGERAEGYYFTWTRAELEAAVGKQVGPFVADYYGVTDQGNFEGRSILHVRRNLAEVAREHGLDDDTAARVIAEARAALVEAREARPRPALDDKILVSWNGLMISAFARASRVLGHDQGVDYLEIASGAARFVLDQMRERESGRLLRSYQGGKAYLRGYVDDYAFFISGLLDLFEASGQIYWLDQAIALDADLARNFEDPSGGYFMTASDHEVLLTREKPAEDGALPSGNSGAVMNLLRLYELTTSEDYLRRADAALRAFGDRLRNAPTALGEMLLALDFRLDKPLQIVVVTPAAESESHRAFEAVLGRTFVPNHVYVRAIEGAMLDLAERVPLVDGKAALQGRATAYVCLARTCELPTGNPEEFSEQIARVTPLNPAAKPDAGASAVRSP